MKKNIVVLILLALSIDANAYDFSVKNAEGVTMYYNYINNGTEVEVTYEGHYKSWNSSELKYDYYYRGSSAYDKTLVIPETVTYNGRNFPVTQLGSYAFADTYNYSVVIPTSIKKWGSYVFQNCSIKEITIPDGVTAISSFTFQNCSSLKMLILPDGLKTIEKYAFDECKSLTSVTIPESVTLLKGFTDCTGLKSITIPKNVTDVYFRGCNNLINIYSYIEDPQDLETGILMPFSETTYYTGTLYVPKGTIEKYKSKEGWKSFTWIEEMTGSDDNKCSTPVMSYSNKELKYTCDTNGATIHEMIKCSDAASTTFSGSHKLNAVYEISAYATADGYSQSETITAKLYWVDGSLNASDINSVCANTRGVLIQCDDDFLKVSGLNNNEQVNLYDISGKIISSTKSVDGTAIFSINKSLKVVVVKVGNDSIKVLL